MQNCSHIFAPPFRNFVLNKFSTFVLDCQQDLRNKDDNLWEYGIDFANKFPVTAQSTIDAHNSIGQNK